MKEARTIIKNSIWLISGEFIGKMFIFALNIIVARNIGIANFGKYNFAMAFAMIFATINDLGLNIFIFREVARNKNNLQKYISNVFMMRVFLSGIFLAAVVIFLEVFKYPTETAILIYLFAGWMCFANLTFVFRTAFKALEIMRWDAVVNVFDNMLRLIITIAALLLGLNVIGIGIAYLVAAFIAFILSLIIFIQVISKLDFKMDFSLWRDIIRQIRFLALIEILIPLFGRLDTVILSHFNGDEAVGLYSAALKIIWILIFIPAFITQAAFAKLSQYAFSDKNKFNNLIGYLLKAIFLATFAVSLVIFAFSPHIILLIYGVKYLASARILQILIWSFPLFGFIGVFIYGLNAKNKQKINAILIGVTVAINVLLAICVAPIFGYLGVAIASIFSLCALSIFFIFYYFRNGYIRPNDLRFGVHDYSLIKMIFSKEVVS